MCSIRARESRWPGASIAPASASASSTSAGSWRTSSANHAGAMAMVSWKSIVTARMAVISAEQSRHAQPVREPAEFPLRVLVRLLHRVIYRGDDHVLQEFEVV